MIFHVVVSVYRLVKIWNSPQFPDEFRNGQWWRGNAQSVDKLFCVFRLALLLVTRCKWFYYILNFDLPHCGRNNREFKQIATAGATTAAVTEKVWGEYVSVVCSQILVKRNTKMSETWTKEFKIYFI